jgi:hypothetical protein
MRKFPPRPRRRSNRTRTAAKLAREHIVAFSLRAHIQYFASVFVRSHVRQGQEGFCELHRTARKNKMSSEQRKKIKRQSALTKGRMLASDGSDDSVDADPFARSKNETANQIKKKKVKRRVFQ